MTTAHGTLQTRDAVRAIKADVMIHFGLDADPGNVESDHGLKEMVRLGVNLFAILEISGRFRPLPFSTIEAIPQGFSGHSDRHGKLMPAPPSETIRSTTVARRWRLS